jgi:hypothetical protein
MDDYTLMEATRHANGLFRSAERDNPARILGGGELGFQ